MAAEISGNAQVFGYAEIFGNATVSGHARVGNGHILWDTSGQADSTVISGRAQIGGNAEVLGEVYVSGNAKIKDHAKVVGIYYGSAPLGSRSYVTTILHDAVIEDGAQIANADMIGNDRASGNALIVGPSGEGNFSTLDAFIAYARHRQERIKGISWNSKEE